MPNDYEQEKQLYRLLEGRRHTTSRTEKHLQFLSQYAFDPELGARFEAGKFGILIVDSEFR